MSERKLHLIEDDLAETWLEDWAGVGVAEIEDFLAKHNAFLKFLETEQSQEPAERSALGGTAINGASSETTIS